jgi:ribulose-phosphate 3-epimerase
MASIAPTVTAETIEAYRDQIHEVANFATRLHIDIADGSLAPTTLVAVNDIWWPGGVRADLHVMLRNPFEHLEAYKALGPQLVIVHAEAEGDFAAFADGLRNHGIEVGVALLPDTPVATIAPAIDIVDHVLIFSGNFGHFGGDADLGLLRKVHEVRALSQRVEIGWDGGINDQNALQLADAGVEVLNVGGFIHNHDKPQNQYELLKELLAKGGAV